MGLSYNSESFREICVFPKLKEPYDEVDIFKGGHGKLGLEGIGGRGRSDFRRIVLIVLGRYSCNITDFWFHRLVLYWYIL